MLDSSGNAVDPKWRLFLFRSRPWHRMCRLVRCVVCLSLQKNHVTLLSTTASVASFLISHSLIILPLDYFMLLPPGNSPIAVNKLLLLLLLLLLFLTASKKPLPYITTRRRNSSDGIATCYGLDGPGIESRWGRDSPHPSRPALGPTQSPVH